MTKDDKREKLLEAAVEVFTEQGYHNAKISKIAEIAGIGAGSVYLYFKGKEQILEEMFVNAWVRIDARLEVLREGEIISATEQICRFVDLVLDMVEQKPRLALLFLHEHRFWSSGTSDAIAALVDHARSSVRHLIELGKQKGEFDPNLQTDLTISFITGAIWHIAAYWTDNRGAISSEEIRDQAAQLILNGIKVRTSQPQ
jgi:TetR/AcrR family fatty acid metabolism transcriptional regulator